MLTTAFLGVAHIHTPDFIRRLNGRPDVHVKAVYDHDAERGERRAAECHATFTSDPQAIFSDANIGSVVICCETARHLDLVERAAAAGKAIFCEKPLAVNAEEADKMARAVQKAGVVFQTGFFMRSSPQAQFMKQEAEAGHLGVITRMRHNTCHGGALGGLFDAEWSWIANPDEAGGGGFADLGAHSLDIILWTLREPCGPVTKVAGSVATATRRYNDIDEYGVGLITFESAAVGILEASWVDPKLQSPIELFGTEGQIQVIGGKVYYYSQHVAGADGGEWTDLPAQKPHAFDLFFDALEGKEAPLVSIEDAAEGSRIMADLYGSAG